MNINMLMGKIVEKGMNVSQVSEKMGISRSSFYRKLNKKGETFTVKEVNMIRTILRLNNKEACDIFFGSNVA